MRPTNKPRTPAGGASGDEEHRPLLQSSNACDGVSAGPLSPAAPGPSTPAGTVSVSVHSGAVLAGPPPKKGLFGLTAKSQATVLHLSLLFALDSFAGGLIAGTLLAYYFQVGGVGATGKGFNFQGGGPAFDVASGWIRALTCIYP
jgi:hypothetical protein